MEVGLTEIDCMLIDDPQQKDELIARQLSHNSIVSQDDPATLKALYDQIEDVDWRAYSGLDDDSLGLLAEVSPRACPKPTSTSPRCR